MGKLQEVRIQKQFGGRMRELRKEKGLSQRGAGARLRSGPLIHRWRRAWRKKYQFDQHSQNCANIGRFREGSFLMFIDPVTLGRDDAGMNRLEEIEKATARLVTQALVEFSDARAIFNSESDLQADIGEDITREALERMGVSGTRLRVIGTMDYKRARLVFIRNMRFVRLC